MIALAVFKAVCMFKKLEKHENMESQFDDNCSNMEQSDFRSGNNNMRNLCAIHVTK